MHGVEINGEILHGKGKWKFQTGSKFRLGAEAMTLLVLIRESATFLE